MCGASASAHCQPLWQGFILWYWHHRAMQRRIVSITDREQLLIVWGTPSRAHVGISIMLWNGREWGRREEGEHNSSWRWPSLPSAANYNAMTEASSFPKWEYKQMVDSNKCEQSADASKAPTPTWPWWWYVQREIKNGERTKMNNKNSSSSGNN